MEGQQTLQTLETGLETRQSAHRTWSVCVPIENPVKLVRHLSIIPKKKESRSHCCLKLGPSYDQKWHKFL
jgi:hypothetical protein